MKKRLFLSLVLLSSALAFSSCGEKTEKESQQSEPTIEFNTEDLKYLGSISKDVAVEFAAQKCTYDDFSYLITSCVTTVRDSMGARTNTTRTRQKSVLMPDATPSEEQLAYNSLPYNYAKLNNDTDPATIVADEEKLVDEMYYEYVGLRLDEYLNEKVPTDATFFVDGSFKMTITYTEFRDSNRRATLEFNPNGYLTHYTYNNSSQKNCTTEKEMYLTYTSDPNEVLTFFANQDHVNQGSYKD